MEIQASGPGQVDSQGVVSSTGAGAVQIGVSHVPPGATTTSLETSIALEFVTDRPVEGLLVVSEPTFRVANAPQYDYLAVSALSDLSANAVQNDTTALHDALRDRPGWNTLSPYVLSQDGDSVKLHVFQLRTAAAPQDFVLASNDVGRCHVPFADATVRTLGDPDVVTIGDDGLVTRTGPGFALLVLEEQGLEAAVAILAPYDAQTPVVLRADPAAVTCDVSTLSYQADHCVALDLFVTVEDGTERRIEPPYELGVLRRTSSPDWMDPNASFAALAIDAASGTDPRRLCFPYDLRSYHSDSPLELNTWLRYIGVVESNASTSQAVPITLSNWPTTP